MSVVGVFFLLTLVPVAATSEEGLVLHLPMDEGTGPTIYDQSGNHNDGAIYGASWAPGISGNALRFDGVGAFVLVPDTGLPLQSSPRTLMFWYNAMTVSPAQHLVSWGVDNVGQGFGTYIATDIMGDVGTFLYFYGYGHPQGYDLQITSNVPENVWTHVAITYDSSIVRGYVNGSLALEKPLALNTGANQLAIGRNPNPSAHFFNGSIDEVRIYDRTLSTEEIAQLYLNVGEPVTSTTTTSATTLPELPIPEMIGVLGLVVVISLRIQRKIR